MHRLSAKSEDKVWKPTPLKRVHICGLGKSGWDFMRILFNDPRMIYQPGTEVWTINNGGFAYPAHLCFNMHDLRQLPQGEKPYLEIYKNLTIPLVTVAHIPELPMSLEYPFQEVLEEFNQTYFANGVSYMVAAALLCGVEEIYFWGCDYEYQDRNDYEAGRANLEFWAGIAAARGVKLSTSLNSTLFDRVWRVNGGEGRIGYGAVYGFFKTQPIINLDSDGKYSLEGFEDGLFDLGEIDDNAR